MIPDFFEHDEYFIDQKVHFFRFGNEYKVFNNKGEEIGTILQKVDGMGKFLRLLLNKKMLPFTLEIQDGEGRVISTIKRGWTFLFSKVEIVNENNETTGIIKQKFSFLKPKFFIRDSSEKQIATIMGNWRAWDFSITDMEEKEIGKVNKKWAGAARELFTDSDKYHVTINQDYAENQNKVNIVSTAIAIDMILKEN